MRVARQLKQVKSNQIIKSIKTHKNSSGPTQNIHIGRKINILQWSLEWGKRRKADVGGKLPSIGYKYTFMFLKCVISLFLNSGCSGMYLLATVTQTEDDEQYKKHEQQSADDDQSTEKNYFQRRQRQRRRWCWWTVTQLGCVLNNRTNSDHVGLTIAQPSRKVKKTQNAIMW